MIVNYLKKFFVISSLATLVFFAVFLSLAPKAQTANHNNMTGYAWSSNIGWISFNCTNTNNCSPGGNGNYGVNIATSGLMTGWAWSDNIGWIKFDGLSNFPAAVGGTTQTQANINPGTGVATGWARACSGTIKSGDSVTNPTLPGDCSTMTSRPDGWDGWISLGGTNYGVNKNTNTGIFSGYAWGSSVVGWVDFSTVNVPTPPGAWVTLVAQHTTIVSGSSTNLSWTSSNISNSPPCSLTGNGYVASTGGPVSTGTLTTAGSPYTFTISCPAATGFSPTTPTSMVTVTVTSNGNPGDLCSNIDGDQPAIPVGMTVKPVDYCYKINNGGDNGDCSNPSVRDTCAANGGTPVTTTIGEPGSWSWNCVGSSTTASCSKLKNSTPSTPAVKLDAYCDGTQGVLVFSKLLSPDINMAPGSLCTGPWTSVPKKLPVSLPASNGSTYTLSCTDTDSIIDIVSTSSVTIQCPGNKPCTDPNVCPPLKKIPRYIEN